MAQEFYREPMLDLFIFETLQLIEQLEQSILSSEKSNALESSINEIFRIMHTIKGSSAMMLFDNISSLAHAIEDVFYFLRENKPRNVNYSELTDIVLEAVDFIKGEINKVECGKCVNEDASHLIDVSTSFLSLLKESVPLYPVQDSGTVNQSSSQKYYITSNRTENVSKKNYLKALIFFEDDCEMENIRAFTVVHNFKEFVEEIYHIPHEIINNEESANEIKTNGFCIVFSTQICLEEARSILFETAFLKSLELDLIDNEEFQKYRTLKITLLDEQIVESPVKQSEPEQVKDSPSSSKHSLISVNVSKLDKLMDLVGELVVSEAMVTQNPDLQGLSLDNFYKAARQLRKITSELQDSVMSIRMVPLSPTLQKMNRIVRDMSKKLNKHVQLEIIGEETEVDKNIIEHVSDPLMHLIRNSIDHGIENTSERLSKGKPETGKITLEAKNAGGEVLLIIKDDGKGMDKEKILNKAREQGLIFKPENELTDREIYSFIFLPGFSTKDKVTEFSGRGVGMDVVTKNIQSIGGTVLIDSLLDQGTVITIKIPLTLAIIDGMTITVGNSRYSIPTTSIRESFRPLEKDIISDTNGNEMILIRGKCYPILRLHELYNVETTVKKISEGIIVMVEDGTQGLCIFADLLLGEQQVVVKALPSYLKKVKGLAGCTLLGDGNISLILDASGLLN